jgi:nucleoside-diphosphate-sugar epimerase
VRIILTGATGFIGSKLLYVLRHQRHELLILTRQPNPVSYDKNERYIQYKIGDDFPSEILDFSPDILIHLAWEGIPDFSPKMCQKNVHDHIKFIKNLKRKSTLKKIIVSGSCVEYGSKTGICYEVERNSPNSYFSWSKQTLHDFFKLFCDENHIKLIWFRLFYVYGPGQREGSLIPTLLKAFQNGQYPELRNPVMANDYIHVNDVIDAFVEGIENQEVEGIYNLGSGKLTAVYQISEIIEEFINKTNKFSSGLVSEHLHSPQLKGFYADISSAQVQLGWKPKWEIKQGIELTYKSLLGA